MELGFRKFISEVFVNGKFPKILPSEDFPLYGMYCMYHRAQPNVVILTPCAFAIV